MKKLIRDGKVGVLVSGGWGSGFSTWGAPLELVFNPTLIELVEAKELDKAIDFVRKNWPEGWIGGVYDLDVHWVDEGTEFIIQEYDGMESLLIKNGVEWITA
jgi:hypothetical protein